MKKNLQNLKEHISGPMISFFLHILLLIALGSIIIIPPRKDDSKPIDATVLELEIKTPEKIPTPPEIPDEHPDENLTDIFKSDSPDVSDTTPEIEVPEETMDVVELPVAFEFNTSILKLPVPQLGTGKNMTQKKIDSLRKEHKAHKNTKVSVRKALEWLAKNQNEDGSWGMHPQSRYVFTGLATLAFLADGQTPVSQKYGENIIRAIRRMIKWVDEKKYYVGNGDSYSHPIVSYALAEAYGITRMPKIKNAMDKALSSIINGMNKEGAFNYYYDRVPRMLHRDKVSGKLPKDSQPQPISDLSFSGWNYQALIAAYAAGSDHPGLYDALKRAVDGLKTQGRFHKEGGFGIHPGNKPDFGMSSVGLLCLGLLNEDRAAETKKALKWLKAYNKRGLETCTWKYDRKIHKDYPKAFTHAIYTWYYQTQALFHACNGKGNLWRKWNKVFGKALINEQNPDGSWLTPAEKYGAGHIDKESVNAEWRHVDQFKDPKDLKIYATSLCCLTLQVYNLQLTTYKLARKKDKKTDDIMENPEDLGLLIN